MEQHIDGETLFCRLEAGGFESILGAQFTELADYLEENAVATGLAAPLFIAAGVNGMWALFQEHNEAGGIRIGFLRQIDGIVRATLPKVRECQDPSVAAQEARDFRDRILTAIDSYNPSRTYE